MRTTSSTDFPSTLHLTDDGIFPNSALPTLVYEAAIELPPHDPAEAVENRFAEHGWVPAWRDGIYDYHHYHSNTHEALGVYRGHATVLLGGEKGVLIALKAGDVLVIPAGVAHKRVEASRDFACVGAYPESIEPDVYRGVAGERPAVDEAIKNVALPQADPIEGRTGTLVSVWAHARTP
jgi:uncharacterized protein YjlB